MSILEDALSYAERCWPVFPCKGKVPATPNGYLDAVVDPLVVTEWFRDGDRNIGLATGGTARLFVLDVDCSDGKQGEESLAMLIKQHGKLPDCPTVRTGGGGMHYYMRVPNGRIMPDCSAGRVGQHLDVRCVGGYVIAPGSTHASGRPYVWLEFDDIQVPDAPEWLLAMADRPVKPEKPWQAEEKIPTGKRHDAARSMAGYLRGMGVTGVLMHKMLRAFGDEACHERMPDDEIERLARDYSKKDGLDLKHVVAGATVDLDSISEEPPKVEASLFSPVSQLSPVFPVMRKVVIEEIAREAETVNLVGAPKVGKSFIACDLAVSVATGTKWLGLYGCEIGNVLCVDMELHPETFMDRLRAVVDVRDVSDAVKSEAMNRIHLASMRGKEPSGEYLKYCQANGSKRPRYCDIEYILWYLENNIEAGSFKLIILDALYRMLPDGTQENDNSDMTMIYNRLDRLAHTMHSVIVVVHHSSKGEQSGKSVTDVGSGAGSISRAADTHITLRRHKQDRTVILDAVTRSFDTGGHHKKCFKKNGAQFIHDSQADPNEYHRAGDEQARQAADPHQAMLEIWPINSDKRHKKDVLISLLKDGGCSDAGAKQAINTAVGNGTAFAFQIGVRTFYSRRSRDAVVASLLAEGRTFKAITEETGAGRADIMRVKSIPGNTLGVGA
jgi:hypothetical protein